MPSRLTCGLLLATVLCTPAAALQDPKQTSAERRLGRVDVDRIREFVHILDTFG